MPAYVAFLRAVNVGGRTAPMATVQKVLREAGFGDVMTYIQTGNIRLTTPTRTPSSVAARVRELLSAALGFDVPTIVRRAEELPPLVDAIGGLPDPFPDGRTYIAFLDRELSAAHTAELEGWDRPGEFIRVVGPHVVYRLGVSFHEARFSNARVERTGAIATTRDLRVVARLAERWA